MSRTECPIGNRLHTAESRDRGFLIRWVINSWTSMDCCGRPGSAVASLLPLAPSTNMQARRGGRNTRTAQLKDALSTHSVVCILWRWPATEQVLLTVDPRKGRHARHWGLHRLGGRHCAPSGPWAAVRVRHRMSCLPRASAHWPSSYDPPSHASTYTDRQANLARGEGQQGWRGPVPPGFFSWRPCSGSRGNLRRVQAWWSRSSRLDGSWWVGRRNSRPWSSTRARRPTTT